MKDFTEIKLFDTSIHVWIWRERWMKERGGNKGFFNCLVGGNRMKENKKNSLVLFKDQT